MLARHFPYAAFLWIFVPASLVAAPVSVIPEDFSGAVQPQIAVAPSGRIHVVFGKENALFHTSSGDRARFSTPVKIGELPKLALGMRRGPRVTATDDLVLVTALSHEDGNIHAWTSTDSGQAWKQNPPVNTTPHSAREGLQALAGNGKGLVSCVWLDLRRGGMELWGRTSRNGGLTWEKDFAIYQSPDGHICECCVPNVAIAPSGEIAVTWRNWVNGSRDLYLSSSPDARAFSPAKKLGSGTWTLNACPMDGGGLSFAPSGSWLAVWRRDRSIFSSDPNLAETKLADSAAQPVTAYAGNNALILWEAGGDLILKRGMNPPVRFAEHAAAASLAGGSTSAAVVWESSLEGKKTILFDQPP